MRGTLALLLTLTWGCVPFFSFRTNVPGTTERASFCGIDHTLRREPLVKLLVIHGMGEHDRAYALPFVLPLADRLNAGATFCPADKLVLVNPEDPEGDYGDINVCNYERSGHTLRVYVLTWSPLTQRFKHNDLRYDWEDPHQWRVPLNKTLKRELIDQAFSDAVLYAGTFKPRMRYAAEQALCITMTDKYTPGVPCTFDGTIGAPTYIVTHSLGSMMLLDAIRHMTAGTTPGAATAAQELGQQLQLVVLLANQFPLLELSTATQSEPPTASRGLRAPSLREFLVKRTTPLKIVAFSDPNDLLSYPIRDDWRTHLFPDLADKVTFINITATNTHTAWAGVFALPNWAHDGYWRSGTVLKEVARGYHCNPAHD